MPVRHLQCFHEEFNRQPLFFFEFFALTVLVLFFRTFFSPLFSSLFVSRRTLKFHAALRAARREARAGKAGVGYTNLWQCVFAMLGDTFHS